MIVPTNVLLGVHGNCHYFLVIAVSVKKRRPTSDIVSPAVSVVGSHAQHTLIWLGHVKLHRNMKVCQTEEPTST